MLAERFVLGVVLVSLASACGASNQEPEAPPRETDQKAEPEAEAQAEQQAAAPEASGPAKIPSSCHAEIEPCTPDPKWVKKLCQDVYPGVALYLFQSASPFTHAYLARRTRAVNASGGATSGEEWLAFDEEVVLLEKRSADLGGMQVSGAGGGYDAMRLDGSCVTLGAEEVRLEKPPAPKYSKVPWRYIGDDMQDALREVPAIREAYIARRKECKGAFSGTVSNSCIKKDQALNQAIIDALLSGEAKLPQPAARP